MRDSGTSRDQLWLIPYNQNEMSSLSIPSKLEFPIIDIDTNNESILVLDNDQNLWLLSQLGSLFPCFMNKTNLHFSRKYQLTPGNLFKSAQFKIIKI